MEFTVASFAITSAICFGLLYILTWHFRRRRLYEMALKFEGPPTLPFIGNAHLYMGDNEHIFKKTVELSSSYPSPFRVWIGSRLMIYITDPDQIKVVCNSRGCLGKGDSIDFCRPCLGTGLLSAPASLWKVRRKLIQPTFNTRILESFVEVFATQSKIFTEQIEKNSDGPEFEIFDYLIRCTLDMICETTMGVKIGAQTDQNSEFLDAQNEWCGTTFLRMVTLWLHPDFIFYRTRLGKSHKKSIKLLRDFTDNVIQKKRIELRKPNAPQVPTDPEDDACFSKTPWKAFLDHLMDQSNDGEKLSDEELRDEVITMVITGNETTATAASYVLLMLGSHQDMQEKVYQELCGIYGNSKMADRPVTPEDLSHMKYLERVIKETLRLFSLGPFFIREITEDLDVGDYVLPKGSSTVIGIIGLHRDEKHWPDPFKFNPDRFLPEEIAERHPGAFMPFSTGPRNCIGSNYAMMSMKTLIATTLRKYIIKTDNTSTIKDMRFKIEIVMKPVIPIKLRIEKRIRN